MSELLDILQSDEKLAHLFVSISKGEVPLTPDLAKKYGYESKNGIPVEYIFAADVVTEVLDMTQGGKKSSKDIIQFLNGFLGGKVWRKDFAQALVHGRGLTPLARMFCAAEPESYDALGLFVMVTLGHKETAGFPEGYLLPNYDYGQSVEAIRGVQRSIKTIGRKNKRNAVIFAAKEFLSEDPMHFWNRNLSNDTIMAENLSQENMGFRVLNNSFDDSTRFPYWMVPSGAEEHLPALTEEQEAQNSSLDPIQEKETVVSYLDVSSTVEPFHSFFEGMPSHSAVKTQMDAIIFDNLYPMAGNKEGVNAQFYSNILLAGSPGVGKTELAIRTAQAMRTLGAVAQDSKIGIVTAATLVGTKVGEVTDQIVKAFKETAQGILIIDEIDHFVSVHSYGKNALSAINGLIGKPGMPALVIGTLYDQNVDQIFVKEEGLRRRFPHLLRMKSYTGEELLNLFKERAVQVGFEEPSHEVLSIARRRLSLRAGGGAGEVDGLLQEIKRNNTTRILRDKPELLISGRDNVGAREEAEITKMRGEISTEDFPAVSLVSLPAGILKTRPQRDEGQQATRPAEEETTNVSQLFPKNEV